MLITEAIETCIQNKTLHVFNSVLFILAIFGLALAQRWDQCNALFALYQVTHYSNRLPTLTGPLGLGQVRPAPTGTCNVIGEHRIPFSIGLYRDVWIAAIASSRTRLATLSGVMCNTLQCELRSLRVNSGMLSVIRIVTYYTLPPLESPTSSWIAMAYSR